jgi:diguanylate cyclase
MPADRFPTTPTPAPGTAGAAAGAAGTTGATGTTGTAGTATVAERRVLEGLVQRSSIGGPAMAGLCARTPARTAESIVARAAARPTGLRAAWRRLSRRGTPGGAARDPGRYPRHRLRGVRYPRRRLALAASGAVVLVLFVVAPRVEALGPDLRLAFADLVPAAAAIASGVMCLHAGRRRLPDLAAHEARQLDRAWRLLGLAGLSWGAGELAWTWYELGGRTVPLPSLADVGFMLAVPLMTAALLAFPTAAPRHLPGRLRVLLDGMIVATSLFGLTWLVSIDVLVTGPSGPWLWDRVVSGFYPLGDVVNLSIAVTALVHARQRALASFGLITAGIALIAISDLGFLYLTQHDAYASGGSIDLGWCVGFFLVGFAALHRPTVPERPRRAEAASLLRAVLPHLSMGALVSAVGILALAGRPVDRELLVGTTAVVLLSVGRHVACLWENARMRRELLGSQQPPERSG